jgi:hypothetical protein
MTVVTWLITAGWILLSTGVLLLSYNFLLFVAEGCVVLWRRIFRTWAGRRLREMGVIVEIPYRAPSTDWKRVALLVAIPVLGFAVHDLMLSPLVFLFGLGVLAWVNFQKGQVERFQVNEDAEMVALQIRSQLSLDHSILNALTRVELAEGRMKQALDQVASRLRMHQPPIQAVRALEGLPGSVTGRLSALIAYSSSLTDTIQDDLLLSLEQEAHRQKLLRSKTRQTLALVRGTIRLLQGVVAAAILFVLLTPVWRGFFLQDIPHRLLLSFLMISSALASLYFEFEVFQLSYGERG